jgi:Transposase IS4
LQLAEKRQLKASARQQQRASAILPNAASAGSEQSLPSVSSSSHAGSPRAGLPSRRTRIPRGITPVSYVDSSDSEGEGSSGEEYGGSSNSDDDDIDPLDKKTLEKQKAKIVPDNLNEPEDQDNVRDMTKEVDPRDPRGAKGEIQGQLPEILKAKSGRLWRTKRKEHLQKAKEINIFKDIAGLKPGVADRLERVGDAFFLYFPTELIDKILKHTNAFAAELRRLYPDLKRYENLTRNELVAFIGILLMMGAKGDTNEHTNDLWNEMEGRLFYNIAMGRERFVAILQMLRFDDHTTTELRKEGDRFTLIREIFEEWNACLGKHVTPGPFLTVDEMLSLFRGNCPFRVYIKSKPGRYGFLIRMMCDAQTRIVLNCDPYVGYREGQERRPSATVCAELVSNYTGKGRNVTGDRGYTTVPLAEELQATKTSYVGTIMFNKRDVPEEMKVLKGRVVGSTLFAYDNDDLGITMVSYCQGGMSKKTKPRIVLVISTMHPESNEVPETYERKVHGKMVKVQNTKNKPKILLDYNATKGGVDTVDQMCRKNSTKRGTLRWSLSYFMTIVDISGVNAYSTWMLAHPYSYKSETNGRKSFMRDLGRELIRPHVIDRLKKAEQQGGPDKELQSAMRHFLKTTATHADRGAYNPPPVIPNGRSQRRRSAPETNPDGEPPAKVARKARKRCFLCTREKYKSNHQIATFCKQCEKFVCTGARKHSTSQPDYSILCNNCNTDIQLMDM